MNASIKKEEENEKKVDEIEILGENEMKKPKENSEQEHLIEENSNESFTENDDEKAPEEAKEKIDLNQNQIDILNESLSCLREQMNCLQTQVSNL